ncbi:hypothetical protein AAG906_017522 [Vitis piasezkii]
MKFQFGFRGFRWPHVDVRVAEFSTGFLEVHVVCLYYLSHLFLATHGWGPQVCTSALDNEIHLNAWCMIAMYICRLVRGSYQYSQSRQASLAKITDTMASLRDVILGLGQRIDGHQASLVPIQGTTPYDSSTPLPPPPSGPTIQSNYTVPPSPPPPIQLAPQAGAFVLHGQTETTPHSVVAPAQVADDTQVCIERIE